MVQGSIKPLEFDTGSNGSDGAQSSASIASDAIAQLALEFANTSDDKFLDAFARSAAHHLSADFVIISRVNPFANIARTVHIIAEGVEGKNFTYNLQGTPCERIVETGACSTLNRAFEQFTGSPFMREMGINSVVGVRLDDSDNEPLGVVLAMTKAPAADDAAFAKPLSFYKPRLARALEAREHLEQFERSIGKFAGGVWDWDLTTGGTTLSSSVRALFGYTKGKSAYDMSAIARRIHESDCDAYKIALNKLMADDTPLRMRMRLKTASGIYREFFAHARAERNAQGKAVRIFGTLTDIDSNA